MPSEAYCTWRGAQTVSNCFLQVKTQPYQHGQGNAALLSASVMLTYRAIRCVVLDVGIESHGRSTCFPRGVFGVVIELPACTMWTEEHCTVADAASDFQP